MEPFAPILLLLFIWIFIGLPMSLARKKAGQSGTSRPAQQARPAQTPTPEVPKPAPQGWPVPLASMLTEPDHDDSVFTGSLGPVSTEGFDPCHDDQLHGLEPVCQPGREFSPVPQETSGLPLGWTPNDMVKGIVMSEILNRKKR